MPPISQVERLFTFCLYYTAFLLYAVNCLGYRTVVNESVDDVVLGIVNEQYYRFNNVSEHHDSHVKYGWAFAAI